MEEQRSSTPARGECLWVRSLQRRHDGNPGGGHMEPTALLLQPQALSHRRGVRSCSLLNCTGYSETNS